MFPGGGQNSSLFTRWPVSFREYAAAIPAMLTTVSELFLQYEFHEPFGVIPRSHRLFCDMGVALNFAETSPHGDVLGVLTPRTVCVSVNMFSPA